MSVGGKDGGLSEASVEPIRREVWPHRFQAPVTWFGVVFAAGFLSGVAFVLWLASPRRCVRVVDGP